MNAQLPYSDTLLGSMFKGDDGPLREMERAELISIATNDGMLWPNLHIIPGPPYTFAFSGLPMVIRPGKPVYRFVFERLVKGVCVLFHPPQCLPN